jgi:hypothetical protein
MRSAVHPGAEAIATQAGRVIAARDAAPPETLRLEQQREAAVRCSAVLERREDSSGKPRRHRGNEPVFRQYRFQ